MIGASYVRLVGIFLPRETSSVSKGLNRGQ